jgi:hypothetical protein
MATQQPNNGETEIQIDFKKELAEARDQQLGQGIYIRLESGKITDLKFTGKATLTNNKWGREQYKFELEEKAPSGEHKVLGITKKNPFAQRVIEQLMEGNFNMKVVRTGSTQADTRYQIIK